MRISELQSGPSGVQSAERAPAGRPASRTEEAYAVSLSSEARAGLKRDVEAQTEAKNRAVAKYEAEQKAAEAQRELRRVEVAMITPSFLDDR